MSANELKEEGNAHFKAQNIDAALACYTKALSLCNGVNEETKDLRKDKGVILKNRAACHLKLVMLCLNSLVFDKGFTCS